ncbi:hypothetical protein BSK20_03080 [SR1 bacterium human oral taxon HOT-345]|nr:hypothetical protein BSK20_03080 [SR1 bacterium human oral taxon HOT-345]
MLVYDILFLIKISSLKIGPFSFFLLHPRKEEGLQTKLTKKLPKMDQNFTKKRKALSEHHNISSKGSK